jgi:D-alanine-D-alanine ligase
MRRLRIGLVYDLLGTSPDSPGAPADADVEFEPPETIEALAGAVAAAGHDAVRLGNPHELLVRIGQRDLPSVDAVWNVAEGHGPRNREAWAPVLLEMAGIPTLGSDALSQSLSLDKAWCLDVVGAAGVRVAVHASVGAEGEYEKVCKDWEFPLFVKPRWEGTSKGITAASRVTDADELDAAVARIGADYDQPALVEPFLPGAEYTVTLIGTDPPRALPILQRALEATSGIGLHAVDGADWCTPGVLDDALVSDLEAQALAAFEALRCRDFARVDFKCDGDGTPFFLEINPLPTFAPDSSFAILAEMEGRPYDAFLAEVLELGLARLGLT